MVDLSTDTMASKESMYLESKVECRTSCWHCLYFALWCEDKYLRRKEIQLDSIKEIHRIRLWIIKNLLNRTEPFVQFAFIFGYLITIFILPMCSKALFSNLVHML